MTGRLSRLCGDLQGCMIWFRDEVSFLHNFISEYNRIVLGSVYIERGVNILLESKALSPSHIAVSCDSGVSVVPSQGFL